MKLPLRQYWQLLARHIQPQKGRFILLAVLLVSNIGLQIVNPQIIRSFIDSALGGAALSSLLLAAAAFLGIAVLQQLASVWVTYLGESVAWTATNALRAELAWHCLNLDMSFHNEHTPGELIERIDGDVTEMASFFSQFVVTILGNLLLLAGILIALGREDWRVGLAFTLFSSLALLVLNRLRDIALPFHKARRQAEADLFGFVEEQLNGTEDIRASGAVDFSLRELYRRQAEILRHDRQANRRNWVIHTAISSVLTLALVMAVLSGYRLYIGGTISIGTVYLFIRYINLLEQPIWALAHEIEGFQTIGACVERLSGLQAIQHTVQDGTQDNLSSAALELAFEQVSFSYNSSGANGGDANVLHELTFQLRPGRVLGLLGRTGSGKTTLTRLVFRLYDPSAGAITLDGMNIRQARLPVLRQRIAIVTQEVQLFRASVRDNLTFFDRSIPDEQIIAALEALELGDWYRALPQGLDTQLETGGHSLSAGEAQLLAFTRIFLRQPGLVILDEASSRLDPATEQRIERAIDKLFAGRTAIIIAHRLETVQRADEVLILEDGRVGEYGLRQELAADPNSRFYHLLQTGLQEVLV